MPVVYTRCCGLDVHKASVTACVLVFDPKKNNSAERLKLFGNRLKRKMKPGCTFRRNGQRRGGPFGTGDSRHLPGGSPSRERAVRLNVDQHVRDPWQIFTNLAPDFRRDLV